MRFFSGFPRDGGREWKTTRFPRTSQTGLVRLRSVGDLQMCGKFASHHRLAVLWGFFFAPTTNLYFQRILPRGLVYLVVFSVIFLFEHFTQSEEEDDDGNFIYIFLFATLSSMEHLMRCKWSAYCFTLSLSRGISTFFLPVRVYLVKCFDA